MRVALAGCRIAEDSDEPALVEALEALHVEVDREPWDGDGDWASYDLVVVRAVWDYVRRRDEFLDWAAAVPRIANPVEVLRWNTDKRYLARLAEAGIPVVPTTYVDGSFTPPEGFYVVKPAVGAGGVDTTLYGPEDVLAAARHVERLQADGRGVLVQPYLEDVETAGEVSVVFLGGHLSHAVRKGPLLAGSGDVTPHKPSKTERKLAEQVLATVPERLLYARVDLLPGPDGPLLLEVELTEPSLFLAQSEGAADRFASAIRSACRS
jgi:glutathione synthase/RimK-type ligase-like ATP-grasp enzyme